MKSSEALPVVLEDMEHKVRAGNPDSSGRCREEKRTKLWRCLSQLQVWAELNNGVAEHREKLADRMMTCLRG
eukprot:CAMPEP_0170620390 /NCGR_PEP_ID=MMETSP0224-20130122/28033_1 /TAXON_ID=285029 /ORGANISM="Togula jolla, Strain CCCM 725" /LENGTH=71 /DNA_ID=CAMNT_0010946561 /DNA_START=692 /DNA_END=903 /DNA_ORIENTATION=-